MHIYHYLICENEYMVNKQYVYDISLKYLRYHFMRSMLRGNKCQSLILQLSSGLQERGLQKEFKGLLHD